MDKAPAFLPTTLLRSDRFSDRSESPFPRLRLVLLLLLLAVTLLQEGVYAQSCGTKDGEEDQGTITKIESQPITGEICGFSEYTYKGGWDIGTNYMIGDSVLYNGAFWRSTSGGNGQVPSYGSGSWSKIDATKYCEERVNISYDLDVSSLMDGMGTYWNRCNYQEKRLYDTDCSISRVCSGSGEDRFELGNGDFYVAHVWECRPDCSLTGFGEEFSKGLEGEEDSYWSWVIDSPNGSYFLTVNEIAWQESNIKISSTTKTNDLSYSVVDDGFWDTGTATQKEINTLFQPKSGVGAVAKEIALLREEDWIEGGDTHAWLGGWSEDLGQPKFSFSGRVVRYHVRFGCLSDDAKLEFTYRVWPIGGDEQADGRDEKETKSAGELEVKKTEDGQKEVKGNIEPKNDYNKRLIKVVNKTPCGGGGSSAGSSNGASVGSVHWWVSLGKGLDGVSVGNLRVEEYEMGPQSFTPERLKYDGGVNSQVEVINDEWGGVRQVKSPECLADMHVMDASSYEIRFYHIGDFAPEVESIGSTEIATGHYAPTGLPFSVWKVENPDGGSVNNRIKISHTQGDGGEVYVFTSGGGGLWTLDAADGLRTEERTETILSNGDKQIVRAIRGSGGTTSYKVKEVHHTFQWGERMIQQEVDPDGDDLTSTWTYYDNATADGGAYGRLKQVVNADKSWERYEYDAQGREKKKVTTWLDGSPSASEGASRVTTTGWSQDGLTATIVETTAGAETGRRYWVKNAAGNQTQNIVCTVAGAGIGASTNLITVTDYVPDGEFKGKVSSVSHPDGTITIYTYNHADGRYTKTEARGASGGSGISAGRQTTTVTDELGNLVSREVRDIASGLALESSTVIDRDEQGRPTRINYSDGTYEEKTYTCCGVESERDRDGVVTNFTYDQLKRVISESRNGLTTLFSYDGSGRVLGRSRKGGDDETVQETNTYDLAGRQTSSKDALDHTTSYSETFAGNGGRVKTTTYPDGGTRVETFHRDGQLSSVEGTGVHPLKYEYGTASGGTYVKEIRVGDGGSETEWATTASDLAGRTIGIARANGGTTTMGYNSHGQLIREVDPDGVTFLYTYDGQGNREKTAVDMDRDGTIGGVDRITANHQSVLNAHGTTVERQETSVVNAAGAEVVASREDMTPNGRQKWSEKWGLLTTSTTSVGANGARTETISLPDGTGATRTYVSGRLTGETVFAGGSTLRGVTNTYDTQGRLQSSTDARNGSTTYTYNALDQVTNVSAPGGQTTSYQYDTMGRQTGQTLADNSQIVNEYFPTGELKKTSGSQTYTVEYTYDSQGRMTTMKTGGQAGPSTTTMSYNPQSGLMTAKTYADGKGTGYTYTNAGRLLSRVWQRGVTTTYGYDNGGELVGVNYSDSTPSVTYTRNRLGQIIGMSDGAGSRTLTSSDDGRPLTESYTGGMFNGVATTIGYDSLKRRGSYGLNTGGITIGYGYDAASRLNSVTSGNDAAAYGYLANSSLIGSITQTRGGNPILTTSKTYDNANRLIGIGATSGSNTVSSHGYAYNTLSQRTEAQLNDGTKWNYHYDGLGQVTGASRRWSDNSAVLGQQYSYSYDGIGNRSGTTVNGHGSDYTANTLNQYTQRGVPGVLDILGSVASEATVTVNNQATIRKGDYFFKALGVDNQASAQYPQVTVTAVQNNGGPGGQDLVGAKSGHQFLPKTPETFAYDVDGNLLSDGRWIYTWDGENRLSAMESHGSAPEGSKKRLEFAYDGNSRRISKKVYTWNGNSYTPSEERRFLYDGWNLVAEFDGSNALQKSYIWGADLSGSLQGAGGVGGLLAMQQGGDSCYPAYDGNGNVMAMIKASNQTVVARYHYGPFGEAIETFEDTGTDNPFRFSTKYHDKETAMAYYGYRFYNPETGRWPSRDLINEYGFRNLQGWLSGEIMFEEELNGYCYVFNSPTKYIDPIGLTCLSRVEVIFDGVQKNDSDPWLNDRYHAPSGRQFIGHMNTYDPEGRLVRTHIVKSGGNRDPRSAVNQGDDTSTPAGNFSVETKRGGIGYLVRGTFNRSNIMIHGYGLTTGCVAVATDFGSFVEDMSDTQGKAEETKLIGLSVDYRLQPSEPPPVGNRGRGKPGPVPSVFPAN